MNFILADKSTKRENTIADQIPTSNSHHTPYVGLGLINYQLSKLNPSTNSLL
jgi:hypothetical protein